MSRNSQAAKIVPEPQGTINLRASLSTLSQARKGVSDALAATAKAVLAMTHEELHAIGDAFLRPVLTEVARAKESQAVLAVIRAMRDTNHLNLTEEDAKNVIGVGYGLPPEAFLADGKNTNLTQLLIAAIRKVPKGDSMVEAGGGSAVNALVSAKVRTNSFLDPVLASDMQLSEKMQVLDLSDGILELRDGTMDALEAHLLRWLDQNGRTDTAAAKIQGVVNTRVRNTSRSEAEEMVRRLAAHAECAHAATVAEALPDSFDTARDEVLRSGSPEALATFWRAHSAKCDKKAFHEKLTEAMRPDPAALADAILENKRYGGRGYHMYHPMMGPMMVGPMINGPSGTTPLVTSEGWPGPSRSMA
jgi:hypothetical protein